MVRSPDLWYKVVADSIEVYDTDRLFSNDDIVTHFDRIFDTGFKKALVAINADSLILNGRFDTPVSNSSKIELKRNATIRDQGKEYLSETSAFYILKRDNKGYRLVSFRMAG